MNATASQSFTPTQAQLDAAYWRGVDDCRNARGQRALSDNPFHREAMRRRWNAGWNSIVGTFSNG